MKAISLKRTRRESGQSVVEFALMMPVIMAVFFYIFEANIHMSAMHQGAYASYMAARGHVVKHNGGGDETRIMRAILTGKLFRQSGPPASVSPDSLQGGKGVDGVIVDLGNMDSLPYTKDLLKFRNKVPTHLGPTEWDRQFWSDMPREQDQGPQTEWYTDNNLPVH